MERLYDGERESNFHFEENFSLNVQLKYKISILPNLSKH